MNHALRLLACTFLLPLIAACSTTIKPPHLSLSDTSPPTLQLHLAPQDLEAFAKLSADQQATVLQLHVADLPPDSPPIAGTVTREQMIVRFTPRYPLQPGVNYRASYNPQPLGNAASQLTKFLKISEPLRTPVTRVDAIYPSADELPENLLKFYIHFSTPMSRGKAYDYINLLDSSGNRIDAPFLQLAEELWNPDMTRLTVFFEPGRVKQGLVPNLEIGPPLAAGKTYTLVIDSAWHDSEGRALTAPARKIFRVTPFDRRQPDPARWTVKPPPAGRADPLTIAFEEPLDRAMLQRVLTVRNPAGQIINGTIHIAGNERQWSFTPQTLWQPGRHTLTVETTLEDNAGNSIGRPFEVDLNAASPSAIPATVEIPFTVGQ